MKMIRISGRGYLRQWKRFGAYLYERGLHHTRQPWSCVPAPKGKGPHWYRRKMKRRMKKRMKRLEIMWARYKKPPRLTEREVKIKQRKQFIEELYRRIKIMAPYYRMRQRVFSCGSINVFEAFRRKFAVKKYVLEIHLADQRILLTQLSFLKSTSTMAGIKRTVRVINSLTRMKMRGALAFKDALVQRKIVNRRLAEKRKYFLNILVPLAEYYHKIKNYDNVIIPRYFAAVEKMVFQERYVPRKNAVEQRFLQVFGVSQMRYMELKAAAKEMGFYLRTRYYFTVGISKVISQLYFAKDIVLDLLRDGHEVLTKMFHYYNTFMTMEALQNKVLKSLEKRRLTTRYKRRELEFEVEFLLEKHNLYEPIRQCYTEIPALPYISTDNKEQLAMMLIETFRGSRNFMDRSYIDGMTNNTMEDIWARHPGNMEVLHRIALKFSIKFVKVLLIIQDENNRKIYFEERRKVYTECIVYVFYSSILYSVRASIFFIYSKRLRPHTYEAEILVIKKLFRVQEDQRLFEFFVRSMFNLTKRTPLYHKGMLGIHHRMIGGNKERCLKDEFKFYRMFLSIRNSLTTKRQRQMWAKVRKAREEKKKLTRLINFSVHAKINPEILRIFNFYRTNFETICPLCCSAERESFLITVGEKEDRLQDVPDIISSAQHYYLGAKIIDLSHDIEHCTQPAATFLLKIKILEERRKKAYLGKEQWFKF
ncbi:unnamed protein product [Nezara viridula]|uniref:Uncharacterized protein n=1 Tax=Nezara viridula TaxID=85310 RepID=A0A9P0EBE9_NEZVI|nr:unnamed protein product [Nezara viridula]